MKRKLEEGEVIILKKKKDNPTLSAVLPGHPQKAVVLLSEDKINLFPQSGNRVIDQRPIDLTNTFDAVVGNLFNYLPTELYQIILSFLCPEEHDILRLVSKRGMKLISTYYKDGKKYFMIWRKLENIEIMASKNGYLNILKWINENYLWCHLNKKLHPTVMDQNGNRIFSFEIYKNAAFGGHIDILNWLPPKINQKILDCAIKGGNISVLGWLKNKLEDFNINEDIVEFTHGNLKVLKWLIKNCPNNSLCKDSENISEYSSCIRNNYYDVFNWILKIKGSYHFQNSLSKIINNANGQISLGDHYMYLAARCGNLDLFKYMVKKCKNINDPYTIFKIATNKGHLNIIEYLSDFGNIFPENLVDVAIENGNLNILKWLEIRNYTIDISKIITHFNINILKWKYNNEIHDKILKKALKESNYDILIWLNELKKITNQEKITIRDSALKLGNIRIIKWIFNKQINEKRVTKYLQKKMEKKTICKTILNNLLLYYKETNDIEIFEKILDWLFKNNLQYPSNILDCIFNILSWDLNIFNLFLNRKCPWNDNFLTNMKKISRTDIVEWICNKQGIYYKVPTNNTTTHLDTKCFCGTKIKLAISKSDKNPNREYFHCPSRICKFFAWNDSKDYIYANIKFKTDTCKRCGYFSCKEEICKRNFDLYGNLII